MLPIVASDPSLFRDVIDRAGLIAGAKFAWELKAVIDEEIRNMRFNQTMARNPGNQMTMPVSPESGSPFQVFLLSGNNHGMVDHIAEMAFHTCYFVIATAYDFEGVEKKQKRPLWRTKMTVEAQGVSMEEIMSPLIANAGTYLGHETPDVAVVKKRIIRDGKVEVGTPTVVEGGVPTPPTDQSGKR